MDATTWISVYIPIIVMFIIIFSDSKTKKQQAMYQKIRNKKRSKSMSEVIKRFIGKECVISIMGETVMGTVQSMEDNWLILKSNKKSGGEEIVNIDYIHHIYEMAKKK